MRAIEERDFKFILDCLHRLREESPEYNFVPPSDHTIEHIWQYFRNALRAGVLFGVIEDGEGFMFGGVSRAWYNPKFVEAYEQLLYVVPERRTGRLGVRLISSFEEAARLLGVHKMHAGATTGIADEKVLKLYEKMGWTVSKPGMEKVICAYRDSIH